MLVVVEAGAAYPSGFIRALIYREWFARAGYEVTYRSRLWPALRRRLDAPGPVFRVPLVGRCLALVERAIGRVNEVRILRAARRADVVYLSKVTSLGFVARLRRGTSARLVLDLVDALWLPRHRNPRLNDVLTTVNAVTTDNEVTAAHVRSVQPACTVIPDTPQVEWFDRRRTGRPGRNDGRIVLGWVGSPGTTYNLWVVWEALEQVFASHRQLHLRLLGADPRALPPFEHVHWSVLERYSQAEMIDEVLGMDVGLFPLQDVEACRVRGFLKATIYMAGAVPVIASPVGTTPEVIEDGVTGVLARTTDEWRDGLLRLVETPDLRARLGRQGLDLVRSAFSVERAFASLRAVLDPREAAPR